MLAFANKPLSAFNPHVAIDLNFEIHENHVPGQISIRMVREIN